jgi:hypothetical protein
VFFFGSRVTAPQSVTQPSRRYQNFVTMLPSKPKIQPERSTSLLYFSLPTTHFSSPHLPNFISFQSIVAEDKRGLPANSSDSLAPCSKCSAGHCTPIPFQNWPCHNSECQSPDLAAETRVQTQVSSCEICGGRSDTGTGFSSGAPVSLVSTIPPVLHTHLHLHFTLTRKTERRSLGTFQKAVPVVNRIALGGKYCPLVL